MRHLLTFASALTLLLCGCADEGPTPDEVRDQFQRGISGEGRLGPIDRTDDPYVNPQGAAPAPQ